MISQRIDTIAVEQGFRGSREAMKAWEAGRKLGLDVRFGDEVDPKRSAPIGSVEWCQRLLGHGPTPDFFPWWLHKWVRRQWAIIGNEPTNRFGRPLFVKSAEQEKAFPATIVAPGDQFPRGPFPANRLLVSSVVKFTQEWRYYVADGKVLATGWYDGDNDDEPAPELSIDWPATFCGAVDFGRLSTGEIALVESQHPYACGWYGDDHEAWVRWLVRGWEYMLERFHE